MTDKKILLTFDYELFFHKSGTPENCLIKPVEKLIQIADKFNYRFTFFIDTIYLERLLNENEYTKNQYRKIEEQLIELVQKGHRIELHLHPHWLDAIFDINTKEWIFPSYRHYALDSLTSTQILDCFHSGVELLNSIARKSDPEYKVIAFRAGGYRVEPFNRINEGFKASGIIIDSSVASGMIIQSEVHNINCLNTPKKMFYSFKESPRIEDVDGNFIEYPISTYKINIFDRLYLAFIKRAKKIHYESYGDGKSIPTYKGSKSKAYLKLLLNNTIMFSVDGRIVSDFLIKKIKTYKFNTINIISHPKLLTTESFNFFEKCSLCNLKFVSIADQYNCK